MRTFVVLLSVLFVVSCVRVDDTDIPPEIVEGLRPVYATSGWDAISGSTPRPIKVLGKIYYKDEVIYAVEQYQGIHVIDNSTPTNPVQIGFLNIIGVRDIAMKGDIMYVDNVVDLVALDVSDISNPIELSRVKNIYPDLDQSYPQGYEGPFECADPAMGIVVGWETAKLEDPKCWR